MEIDREAREAAGQQRLNSRGGTDRDGWGGTCKNGADCVIGAFATSDPSLATWRIEQLEC